MYLDNIHLSKRETITNGAKYDFFIYNMLSLESKFSDKKWGKGDTVISKEKDFLMLDQETKKKLDVKLRCSKKLDDAMEGIDHLEAKKVFKKCIKELESSGLLFRKKQKAAKRPNERKRSPQPNGLEKQ